MRTINTHLYTGEDADMANDIFVANKARFFVGILRYYSYTTCSAIPTLPTIPTIPTLPTLPTLPTRRASSLASSTSSASRSSRSARRISPHLPTPPHISPYLPLSAQVQTPFFGMLRGTSDADLRRMQAGDIAEIWRRYRGDLGEI